MVHMARETLTQYDHWVQGNPWATNVACWYATLTWSSTAYLANAGAHLAVSTLHYTLSMADRAISHGTPPPTALPHTEYTLCISQDASYTPGPLLSHGEPLQ
jgi:hypothetical protein